MWNPVSVLMAFGVAVITSEVQLPVYPLLHIGEKMNCSGAGPCTKDTNADGNGRDYQYAMTPADASVLNSFSLLHMSPKNPDQIRLLHKKAPNRPLVKYTETVPVCGGSGGQETPYVVDCNNSYNFETGGFRRDAKMYQAGNLTEPLDMSDTLLHMCLAVPYCCKRVATPLVPSTASGPYSDYDGNTYVTFLRVGDELMKILTVVTTPNPDPEIHGQCQRITVARSLDGSPRVTASVGTPVLAPVFGRTPVWVGPKASGKLSYQADYQSFYAWSSLANFTIDAVTQLNYDGGWFDSFTPSNVANGADVGGLKVSLWNTHTNRPYTPAEAHAAQRARLQKVFDYVYAKLGRYPVIWANNFERWFDQSQKDGELVPGDKRFMRPGPNGERPFDGCSLESWTAGFEGPGCFPQTGDVLKWAVIYHDEPTWISRVNTMIDATKLNLSVAAMTGSAGCQSPLQTYISIAARTQLDLLHYASFLLTVGNSTIHGPLLGTCALFAEAEHGDDYAHGLGVAKLWEPYTWNLGFPSSTSSNVTAYRVASSSEAGVYVRYFSSGVAVVNPGNLSARTAIPLDGGPYEDLLTGEKDITSVQMSSQSGRVLLRSADTSESKV